MTSRDSDIIDFLHKFKVANTTILQYLFFPSVSAAQKRLKKLSHAKNIKRARDSINNEYIYFIKRPQQLKHCLAISKCYVELSKMYQVVEFKREPKIADIRPDALFAYIDKGINKLGFLEVELSNKGLDTNKYKRFIANGSGHELGIYQFDLFVYRNNVLKKIEIL